MSKYGAFPYIWNKCSVIPAHKKMQNKKHKNKKIPQKNQPVPLLPIFGTIFERIIF